MLVLSRKKNESIIISEGFPVGAPVEIEVVRNGVVIRWRAFETLGEAIKAVGI